MRTPPANPIPETTTDFEALWQMLNTPQPASSGPRLQVSGPSFEIDLPMPPFGPHRNEQQ